MTSTTIQLKSCPYCGAFHQTVCPLIESIEYFPNGSVKRVILRDPGTPRGPQNAERFT